MLMSNHVQFVWFKGMRHAIMAMCSNFLNHSDMQHSMQLDCIRTTCQNVCRAVAFLQRKPTCPCGSAVS